MRSCEIREIKQESKIHPWTRTHKFSDLQHTGWSRLSFCGKFICINKAEGDIKQKALKAYVGSLKTQLLCLATKRQRYFSGRSFSSYLWFKFQVFLLLFPLLLFILLKSCSTLIIQYSAYHQRVHLVSAKLTTNPLFRGAYGGFTKEGKKPCTGEWRPSRDQATGLWRRCRL